MSLRCSVWVGNGIETSRDRLLSFARSSSRHGLCFLLLRFALAVLAFFARLPFVLIVVAIDLAGTFGVLLALKHLLFLVGLLRVVRTIFDEVEEGGGLN